MSHLTRLISFIILASLVFATLNCCAEKALEPGPADQLPEVDIEARLITKPSQLAGKAVNLPEKSPYRRT